MLSPALGIILRSPPGWVLKPHGQLARLDLDFVNDRAWNAGHARIPDLLSVTGGVSTGSFYTKADGTLQSFAANVLRYGTNGLLVEEARTTVVLHNRDLTNAAHVKTDCTAAKDQTGPDGVTNSASSLTATGANATCLQAITLASSARFQTAYVKRITGSGTINMTMDNGSTWTVVTVTAAWTRVSIPTQTLADPTVGFRIVTSGDAIAVDLVQNENGIRETSPIATTTVAVTRAAEVVTFSNLTWFDGTAQSLYAQWLTRNIANARVWGLDAANDFDIGETSGMVSVLQDAFAGTVNISSGNTALAGSSPKTAVRLATNDCAICMNGGTVVTDTSATQPGTLSASRLGSDRLGTNYINTYIKRVAAFKSVLLANAAAQALTT